jgi:hypothetical protein
MITSQIDQVVDRLPNGLIPSNINPSHKFWRSTINSSHVQLMWTHALESITCQTNPSWYLLPWCHFYNSKKNWNLEHPFQPKDQWEVPQHLFWHLINPSYIGGLTTNKAFFVAPILGHMHGLQYMDIEFELDF